MNPYDEARKEERENRAKQKAALRQLTVDNKLSFFRTGVYTIAYKRDRRDLLTLSTSIRHPNDKDDVMFAKLLAAERFVTGKTIQVKKSHSETPSTCLFYMFS